jgi:hypothetical protein
VTAEQNIELSRLKQKADSGGRWFYWIAGLSLITSLIALTGNGWGFLVSLGVTQVASAIGANAGDAAKVIAVIFVVLATGLFAGFGVLAAKRYVWAFVLGIVLYALDGLIFVLIQNWIGLVFHGLVVYWLIMGCNACRQFNALQREIALSPVTNAPFAPPVSVTAVPNQD